MLSCDSCEIVGGCWWMFVVLGAGLVGHGASGAASFFDITRRVRVLVKSWVTHRVLVETPSILKFQRFHHKLLDNFISVLSLSLSTQGSPLSSFGVDTASWLGR